MPSKHDKSDAASRKLCDCFLETVTARYSGIQLKQAATCCSISVDRTGDPSVGRSKEPRIFFVYHQKNRILVWPRWAFSSADDLKDRAHSAGLSNGPRKKQDSTWARNFPLSIALRSAEELVRLLPIMDISAQAAGARHKSHAPEDSPSDEIRELEHFFEGAIKTVRVNAYERSEAARTACIAHFGASCTVCGFDFAGMYGDLGRGFIHVHHLVPLAQIGAAYSVDPVRDLRSVCPNCHEMIHRRQPPLTVEELRLIIAPSPNLSHTQTDHEAGKVTLHGQPAEEVTAGTLKSINETGRPEMTRHAVVYEPTRTG